MKKYKSNKFPFDFQYTSVKIAELFEQRMRRELFSPLPFVDERVDFGGDEFLQDATRFVVVGGEEHDSIFPSSFRGARSASPESIDP